MVDKPISTYQVRRGDSPWKVAKRNLAQQGRGVSNGDIIKEMQRLAKLNGCDNVDDFGKKFFNRVGLDIKTQSGNSAPTSEGPEANKQTNVDSRRSAVPTDSTRTKSSAPADSTRRDSTFIHKPDTTRVEADSTRVVRPVVADSAKVAKTPFLSQLTQKTAKEQEVEKINNMQSDEARIVEYNKKNYDYQYYGIVDKKSCQLKIYDKSGKVVKQFTVGVGKTKGDNIGSYYLEHFYKTKDAYKAESNRYTTAGEFTLDEVQKTSEAYTGQDGKPKIMHLKGDNKGVRSGQLAIHMLYKPAYAQRKAAIDSPGLEDNRMSYGCVNLTEEDYDIMHKYLGEGNKLYVLPEEKGNKLQLEKQKDGSYKFAQQYHKDDARGMSAEQASKVNYDMKPKNNPKYIAQQKQKAQQQRDLAQKQEKSNETVWYNPMTWFS